jgi:hypothetical protein
VLRADRRDVRAWFVDLLDQVGDPRRHHKEILGLGLAGVLEGVRRAAPSEHRRSWRSLDVVVTRAEAERSREHVPRLVVAAVDVQRRDPVVGYGGLPLDDHKVIAR